MAKVQDIIENGTADQQNALIAYAKSRYATENVGFLWAVSHYRKLANKTHRMPIGNVPIAVAQMKGVIPFEYRGGANIMGKWIYDTYIDPKSPLQVNLPAEEFDALRKIANTRSSPFTPPDFDAAYETIAKLMNSQRKA